MTVGAVIFDMDGVLTDSEPLINAAAVAMFAERGLVVAPADFRPFVGMGEDRYIGGVAEAHRFDIDVQDAKRRTYELYFDLARDRLLNEIRSQRSRADLASRGLEVTWTAPTTRHKKTKCKPS